MKIQKDLQYIKEDTTAVKKRTMELNTAKERCSMNLRMLVDDSFAEKPLPSLIDQYNNGAISGGRNSQGWIGSARSQSKVSLKDQANSPGFRSKDANGRSDSTCNTNSGLTVARKWRIHAQVTLLAYFSYFLTFAVGWSKGVQVYWSING